jgi:hypothetical protein
MYRNNVITLRIIANGGRSDGTSRCHPRADFRDRRGPGARGPGAFSGLINLGFCDTFPAASKIGYPARLNVSKQHFFITVLLLDSSYEF